MIRQTVHALAACVVTFALCAVGYPLAVWALGWALFPDRAEGSLIYGRDKTTVIGSELIAQPFASDKYFAARPSAVDYKADAAGGSNLGPKNPDLHAKVKERAEALKATDQNPAPVDLISASGSGLDPHISPDAAYYQAPRVASARGMSLEQVRSLIDRMTEHSGAMIGAPPRVNVLKLNLALDEEKPAPASPSAEDGSKPSAAPASAGAAPAAAEVKPEPAGLTAVRDQVEALTKQLGGLRAHLDKHSEAVEQSRAVSARSEAAAMEIKSQLKGLDQRLIVLADASARVEQLSDRIGALDDRLQETRKSLVAVETEVHEVRDAVKASPKPEPATEPDTSPKPAIPARRVTLASDADLNPALAAFRQARYAEAADAFRTLTQSKSDDARVWYLAAVSRGLATKEWGGETVALVEKALEREKAGTPARAAIEVALNPLSPATGKDWVAYYRNRLSAR